MAVAPAAVASSKLIEPLPSMVEGQKFLKWTEIGSSIDKSANPTTVTLRTDEKCFILFWRDANKKCDYLDIAYIRDVRTGKQAVLPKDKSLNQSVINGKSVEFIKDRTISIMFGTDFCNIQCINFVSLSAENATEIAKDWTDFIFKCAINHRTQNLSPWEHLIKFRSTLLYGKSTFDEKSQEYRLPVLTLVEAFITSGKQNLETERQHITQMLQTVGLPYGKNDMLDEHVLTMEKFFQFFLRLVSKEDIDQVFSSYSSKRKWYLSADQFENFLNKEQRDPGLNELLYPFYTTDKSAEMIHKFEVDDTSRKNKQMSPQGLIRYLMDCENEVVDPAKYEACDSMDQSLSHYFINSSHNTYLTGHQITGKSDADMYRQVLLAGCRCIELDCHEDDNLDEPIITHGRTLCTKILFSEAIHAIKEAAFKTSPYPVLLSFENFCGKRMQDKMVKYLVDILGDMLLSEPLAQYPLVSEVPLPSPEDLKYKILIKFRKKRSQKMSQNSMSINGVKGDGVANDGNHVRLTSLVQSLSECSDNMSSSPAPAYTVSQNRNSLSIDYAEHLRNPILLNSYGARRKSSNLDRANSQQTNSDSSDSDKEESSPEFKKLEATRSTPLASAPITIKQPIQACLSNSMEKDQSLASSFRETLPASIEMANIVNYLQPVTFRSFEISQKRNRSFEISSFVETHAYNLHKEKPTEFVNYNKRQFCRIYPKGTRISSDNFLPQIYWNVGCQLVAMNFQTLDLGMRLNLGKFEYNNRSGYVLKPQIMRRTDVNKQFDPFAESPLDGIVASTLKIRIISGIFLNCSNRGETDKRLGSTVHVELFGLPADSVRGSKAHRVKASSSNTFNVVYSDQGVTFRKIIMPELALLNLTAYDDQNKIVGHRVLPIIGLKPGFRYVCLKNESNQPLNMCVLFVHIKVHDYVPEEYEELAKALVNPIDYVISLSKKDEMLRKLADESENNSAMGNDSNLTNEDYSDDEDDMNADINNNEKPRLDSETDPTSSSGLYSSNPGSMTKFIKTSNSSSNIKKDPNLFREIDIESLKSTKTYQQVAKTYKKKIEKAEKDAEKKVAELLQSMNIELERTTHESNKLKAKINKSCLKQIKNRLGTTKELKQSKSTADLDFISAGLNNLDMSQKSDNELNHLLQSVREKYVRQIINVYDDTYKAVQAIQTASIQPLCSRLEKLIQETLDQRMNELKSITEKEITEVNKQTHLQIKFKKKRAAANATDRDEFNRLSREIERESVSFAASENAKMDELLKAKQKLLRQLIEKSLNGLKEYKEKQAVDFQNDYVAKLRAKTTQIRRNYLNIDSDSTGSQYEERHKLSNEILRTGDLDHTSLNQSSVLINTSESGLRSSIVITENGENESLEPIDNEVETTRL